GMSQHPTTARQQAPLPPPLVGQAARLSSFAQGQPGRLSYEAALAVLLILCASTPAQPPPAGATDRRTARMERPVLLLRLLSDSPSQPSSRFAELKNPRDPILIVLGRTDRVREVPRGLQRYVTQGGAVLLATDRMLPRDVREVVRATAGVSVN